MYLLENYTTNVLKLTNYKNNKVDLYPYQKSIIDEYGTSMDNLIILKHRMTGISCINIAYCIHRLLNGYNTKTLYLTPNYASASHFTSLIERELKTNHDYIEYTKSRNTLILENSNSIKFSTFNKNHFYAETFTDVIMDEMVYANLNVYDISLIKSSLGNIGRLIYTSSVEKGSDMNQVLNS